MKAVPEKRQCLDESVRVKADIIPFKAEYSRTVYSWIDSEETYRNVCRGSEFPPPDDLIDSWQREGMKSFLLSSKGRPVAYGEIWNRPLDVAVELAHILVDPTLRGQGFGTKTLELLFQRAAQRDNVAKVMVNLYGDSEVALGCYLKAGFELIGTTTYTTGLKLVRLVE